VERKRSLRAAKREKKLAQAEKLHGVRVEKPVETVEDVDGKIEGWLGVRDRMLLDNETRWLHYHALMELGEERVRKETGFRWPESEPGCTRGSREEVREAIRRTANREGKKIEEVEWWMQSVVHAPRKRYFTW